MRKALEGKEIGIKINGKLVNNVRYAYDTVLIAKIIENLQHILNKDNQLKFN